LGYIFEWDAKKAESNTRKHGVTFDEASTAFSDPLALLMPDPDHSFTEERYLVLGMSISKGSRWWRLPSGHGAPA